MNLKMLAVLENKFKESPENFRKTVESVKLDCDAAVFVKPYLGEKDPKDKKDEPIEEPVVKSLENTKIPEGVFQTFLRLWYMNSKNELLDAIEFVLESGYEAPTQDKDPSVDDNCVLDPTTDTKDKNELKDREPATHLDHGDAPVIEPETPSFSASIAQSHASKFPKLGYAWEKNILIQLGEGGDSTVQRIQHVLQEVQKSAINRLMINRMTTDISAVHRFIPDNTVVMKDMQPYRNLLFSRLVNGLIIRSRSHLQTLMAYVGDGIEESGEEMCRHATVEDLAADLAFARIPFETPLELITVCCNRSLTSLYQDTDFEHDLNNLERIWDEIGRCEIGKSVFVCQMSLATPFNLNVLVTYKDIFSQIYIINTGFRNHLGILFLQKRENSLFNQVHNREKFRLSRARANVVGGPRTMLRAALPETYLYLAVIEKINLYNSLLYNEETNKMLEYLSTKFM